MKMEIVTPKGVALSKEIDYFVVKTKDGEYAILKDHIPTVSAVKEGFIKVVSGGEMFYAISSAVIEFKKNVANVMAQSAFEGSTIEHAKGEYEKYKAEIDRQNKKSKVDYTKIEQDLQKSVKEAKAGKL